MRNCLILVIVIITTFSICYRKQFDEAVKDAAKNDNISFTPKERPANQSNCSCLQFTCGNRNIAGCSVTCFSPEYASCSCGWCSENPKFDDFHVPVGSSCGCK